MSLEDVKNDWVNIHPPMKKEERIMNTLLESYRNKWSKMDTIAIKDKATAYAEELRREFPERQHKHSKAKIPFNRSGDQMISADKTVWDQNTRQYVPSGIQFKPNYIWADALEIISFHDRYMGETCAVLRSLIDNRKYYMGVHKLNDIWNKVRGNCIVGLWSFEKNGKISKLVPYEEE